MSVDCIVQQVQYEYFDCHQHMLLLSLACRILVHGTQKHHVSKAVSVQLFPRIRPSTVFYFTITVSDALYLVYLLFETFLQSLFLSPLLMFLDRS